MKRRLLHSAGGLDEIQILTKFVSARRRKPARETRALPQSVKSVESAVELIDDFEAHLAGGAGDDAEGGFIVARV
jgi:hypothetical protein